MWVTLGLFRRRVKTVFSRAYKLIGLLLRKVLFKNYIKLEKKLFVNHRYQPLKEREVKRLSEGLFRR
jgi:hypothetical protein